MENNLKKKQLLEIIENYKNKKATAKDVIKLAEIICYESPYPIKYFNSSPSNNIKINDVIKFNFDKKGVVTSATTKEGALEVKTIKSETGNSFIDVNNITTLSINADFISKLPFNDALQIIGHEMRHYFQAQALKSIILDGKIPAGIKQDVADSMSYGLIAQNNLSDLLKLTHIAKN